MKHFIRTIIAKFKGDYKPQTLSELLDANLAAGRLVWEWE